MDHRRRQAAGRGQKGDDMTLTQLKYFCEVARMRHFTAAANNLYVAQSSLSYSIRELESELGVSLFIRRPNRKIDLTPYGKALLPYAEASLKMIEDGEGEIISMKSSLYGKVKMEFFFSVATTFAPVLISRFRDACTEENNIELNFEVAHNWTDLREHLIHGQCDMVISASKFTDGCESEFIGNHRIYLIVPAGHPLASRDSVTVQDFCNEKIIAIDINSNLDTHIKNIFKAEDVKPDMTYVSDWTAQHLTVAAGGGLGLSVGVPHNLRAVHMIPVDHPEALMPLYLTWATGRKLTPAASFVKDKFLEITRCMTAMGEAF